MLTLKFKEMTTDEELTEVADMAAEIWNECFSGIISQEQTDYMLEKFQSFDAIKEQVEGQGYRYFTIRLDDEAVGYYAVYKDGDTLFLSKFYLYKSYRRRGLASLMMKEVKKLARKAGCDFIKLYVDKNNSHAVSVYKHFNMVMIKEEHQDIGGGYFMDSYQFGKGV